MTQTRAIVLLIRHGENDWVGSNRLAGRTPDVHLNERGREQAETLATMLQEQPIAAVYSSPLERCMETAQPLAAKMELATQPETGVIEVGYGDWQGAELKELAAKPEWQMVQHYPSQFCFPGGETLRAVQGRAVDAINAIAERHANELVAIYSHGDVIRTSLAHYLGLPLDLFQRIVISTASISAIAFTNGRPMILTMNHVGAMPIFNLELDKAAASAEEPATEE